MPQLEGFFCGKRGALQNRLVFIVAETTSTICIWIYCAIWTRASEKFYFTERLAHLLITLYPPDTQQW